jgi:cell division septation protein DedD
MMEEHLFRPGHKEVVFNPSLTHNDGLLTERYMNVYNATFQKARRMVEEDVEEIKSTLLKGLNVSLGNIGSLCRGDEGQIVFRAGDSEVFCVDLYGLAPFRLETWQAMQDKETPLPAANERRNIFYIPVNRNIVRGIASTAAAVALFLMISTPVKEINPSSYTASFIPTEIVKTNKKTAEDTPAPAGTPRATTPSVARPKPNPAVRTGERKETLPIYYVIISSVKTAKQAEEVMTKASRQSMKNVGKLLVDDKIRVCADKFTDKNKAELYLTQIRKNPAYKDAWLYTRNK